MAEIFPPPIPKTAGIAAQGEAPKRETWVDKAIKYVVVPAGGAGVVAGKFLAPETTGAILQTALGYKRTATGAIVPKPIAIGYALPQPFGVVDPAKYDLRPGYLYVITPKWFPESGTLQILAPGDPEVQEFRRQRAARLGPNAPAVDVVGVAKFLGKPALFAPGGQEALAAIVVGRAPDSTTSGAARRVFGNYAADVVQFGSRELRGQNRSTQRTANVSYLPDIPLEGGPAPAGRRPPPGYNYFLDPGGEIYALGPFDPKAFASTSATGQANKDGNNKIGAQAHVELRDP